MQESGRVRIPELIRRKTSGQKIAMLTAYDASMARLLDVAGIDVLLVGDSLGTVIMGCETTIPVTLDVMLHHTRAVVRGAARALVVADMPFLTYHISAEDAVRNAGRLIQEGGAAAVKLEGGATMAPTVERIVGTGIPVMGHIGLLPQSVHSLGGYRMVGKTENEAGEMRRDAVALERAGVFALVLECIPADVAEQITRAVKVPTIGIGAGPHCDGQVLVSYDAFGLFDRFVPRFVKQYARLGEAMTAAAKEYVEEVQSGQFPAPGAERMIATIAGIRQAVAAARQAGQTIGLVPTMGALHAGHGALMDRARAGNDCVVVTIFVNPIQFDRPEDYAAYAVNLERDLEFCHARGVDLVFAPSAQEMYPEPPLTFVEVTAVAEHLCGKFRPGHFRGVATVVSKLFHIVQADRAYFGQKDAQQLAVIRRMVADQNFAVEIVGVATVREPDGLALSSRNRRLSAEERRGAPALFQALTAVRAALAAGQGVAAARAPGLARLAAEPLLRVEYLEVVDARTMTPVVEAAAPLLVAGAVWAGATRLIDNL